MNMNNRISTRITSMLIVILIALCLSTTSASADQTVKFTEDQVKRWNGLRLRALDISDQTCSDDVLDTLEEAHFVYLEKGLSPAFMDSLLTVSDVSGNITQAGVFRGQFLVAFQNFASSIGYTGQVSKSLDVVNIKGISSPIFYGHRMAIDKVNLAQGGKAVVAQSSASTVTFSSILGLGVTSLFALLF
ncbi:hypothetical protein BC829DRAFT_395753 [Chytridium lagenaria]|nr:hypothetical protein BC829DRAFT_395753 [Chytridium lagenaria]